MIRTSVGIFSVLGLLACSSDAPPGASTAKDVNLTDSANPIGALQNIAGICNEKRNVAGLMPHPERACEPLLGSDDGKWIFESIFAALKDRTVAKAV